MENIWVWSLGLDYFRVINYEGKFGLIWTFKQCESKFRQCCSKMKKPFFRFIKDPFFDLTSISTLLALLFLTSKYQPFRLCCWGGASLVAWLQPHPCDWVDLLTWLWDCLLQYPQEDEWKAWFHLYWKRAWRIRVRCLWKWKR